jgi:hypothetical protein
VGKIRQPGREELHSDAAPTSELHPDVATGHRNGRSTDWDHTAGRVSPACFSGVSLASLLHHARCSVLIVRRHAEAERGRLAEVVARPWPILAAPLASRKRQDALKRPAHRPSRPTRRGRSFGPDRP